MKLDAALARKTTGGPISSGSAQRCIAAGATQSSWYSGRSTGDASVRTYPGATAFTRMPCGAHSAARPLVSWCTAALDARYAGCQRGRLTIDADMEPTLTIVPGRPCATSSRATAREQYQTPSRLVASVRCHTSSPISRAAPPIDTPALLTSRSTVPRSAAARATTSSTCSRSVTSST